VWFFGDIHSREKIIIVNNISLSYCYTYLGIARNQMKERKREKYFIIGSPFRKFSIGKKFRKIIFRQNKKKHFQKRLPSSIQNAM
jgi:hypothetical protein